MANLLFDMRNLAKVLGCESISVKTSTSIFDTDWKHQHEEKALRLFESVYGEDVKQSGLKIHPKHTFLGTTTDGILNDGILTICCPRTRSIWGSIPHTSWIRMQIEMEVFDTNKAYFFQVEYPEERYRLQIVNRDTIWFNEVLPEIRKSMSRKRKRDVDAPEYIQFHDIEPILNGCLFTAYLKKHHASFCMTPKRQFDYNRNQHHLDVTVMDAIGRRRYTDIKPHMCDRNIKNSYESLMSGVDVVKNPIFTKNNLIATIPLIMDRTLYHYAKSKQGVGCKLLRKIAYVDLITNSSYKHRVMFFDHTFEDIPMDRFSKYTEAINVAMRRYDELCVLPVDIKYLNELDMNMKVSYPKWDHIRKDYAKKKEEITQIWKISNADKQRFKHQGYTKISQLLPHTKGAVNSFIRSNLKKRLNWRSVVDRIKKEWESNQCLSFIDFETADNIIFMIGIVYKSKFYVFTSKSLDREGEADILRQFVEFDKQHANTKYVHWSSAERSNLRQHLKHRHNSYVDHLNSDESKWFDLAITFKKEGLVFPGMDSFKLKSVVGSMHALNLIKTKYDPSSLSCMNGVAASSYGLAYYDGVYDSMEDIVRYNEIDCQVLSDIVGYFESVRIL